LVRQISGTSLRRTLFHTAVAEEVHNKYTHSKRESDRQVIAGIVTSKILKYRLQRLAEEVVDTTGKLKCLQVPEEEAQGDCCHAELNGEMIIFM
jgi:hypothetical protein